MTKKAALKEFVRNSIPAVLIGGLAMRIYNSPRVTHAMDLAIRTLDIDKIVTFMYESGFYLATYADDESVTVCLHSVEASEWVESSRTGSMSFFCFDRKCDTIKVPISSIDITSEIDFMFDVSIPFAKLYKNSRIIELDTVRIHVAAAEDLLYLKGKRPDKSASDYADIEFLKDLLDTA